MMFIVFFVVFRRDLATLSRRITAIRAFLDLCRDHFSVVYSFISYYSSAKIALSLAKAKAGQKADNPDAV